MMLDYTETKSFKHKHKQKNFQTLNTNKNRADSAKKSNPAKRVTRKGAEKSKREKDRKSLKRQNVLT